MLTLALLLAATPLPAGTVVVGLSAVEGTGTELVALTPSGERELLAEVEHQRGRLPRGLLMADRVVLVTAVPDGSRGVVEEVLLADGARRVLADGALAAVPPALDATGAVLFVRQPRERHCREQHCRDQHLEVVRAHDGAVMARADAAWLHPARGRGGAFLVVAPDGGARLALVADGALRTVFDLGKVSARSPALVGGRAFVEIKHGDGAHVIDAANGRVLHAGLAGMDPLPLGGATVAWGAGTKAAAVVIDDGRARRTLTAPQSGVAHPLAGVIIGERACVVAWLDRGASLPGELWWFADGGARRLLDPAAGLAVEVYGVVAP